VLAGVALAVRLAAMFLDPVMPRDGVALAETVAAFANGDFSALTGGPLHPLALLLAAFPAALGVPPERALALVAALASAAAVIPMFLLTRRIVGRDDDASAACLLFAVAPPLVRTGSTALSEGLLLFFALASLHFAARALRHFHPARDAMLAGAFAGAAWLARPEGLALIPLVVLVCLPSGGGRPLRGRLLAAALAPLAALLVAAPWLLLRAFARGSAGPFGGKDLAVLVGSRAATAAGGAATGVDPGVGASLFRAAGAVVEGMHPGVAIFVLVGLIALVRLPRCGKTWGPVALLGAAALAFTGGLALLEWRYGYGGRRHAAAAATVLLPFAGVGFVATGRLLERAGGPFRRPSIALGTLLAVVVLPLLAGSLLQRDASGAEARSMGLLLRASDGQHTPTIATFGEPRIAWYARGTDVRLLRIYGVAPGLAEVEAKGRANSFIALLQGTDSPEWIVLRDGDPRVPPGVVPETAPAHRVGRLAAWQRSAWVR
jgi:hypothetical protein